jgi:hypothetical protein
MWPTTHTYFNLAYEDRTQIGMYMARTRKVSSKKDCGGHSDCWFFGIALIVLLVMEEADINPGPLSEQDKINQIVL